MGVFSEMDYEHRYGDAVAGGDNVVSAFSEEPTPPTFAENLSQPTVETPTAASAPVQRDGAAHAEPKTAEQDGKAAADKAAAAKADDEAKRKAHEEAEAKRKAEFEARQAKKKADEQAQIAKLEAMTDDEVTAASMQRVSTDTEKLTRRNMKECVAEYIQTICIEDPVFARKTMHPRKSMIRCFQYISKKAWEYVQDELKANNIQPGPGREGYGCDVPDDLCYQWAVEYFNNPNAEIDSEDDEEFVPKPYIGGSSSKTKSRTKSKGKTADKKGEDKKAAEKKTADNSGQISLGDFAMPEEKAG